MGNKLIKALLCFAVLACFIVPSAMAVTSQDANIWQVDGNDVNAALPTFGYYRDGSLTVKFWARDTLALDLNANLYYGATKNAKTVKIFGDQNLSMNGGLCDANTPETGMVCSKDWNISAPLADGNYFLTLEINNGVDTNIWGTSASLMVDNTKPTVRYDGNSSTWQNFDANVRLTCTDAGSKCSIIRYRRDTDPSSAVSLRDWTTFDANIQITTDGNYVIDFNALDGSGNIGDVNRQIVLVDKTAPHTTDNFAGDDVNYTTIQYISLTCSDANSGCAYTTYRIDLGAWQTGNSFTISTDGNHRIDYNSTDVAGNTESSHTIRVSINKANISTDGIFTIINNTFRGMAGFTLAIVGYSGKIGTGIAALVILVILVSVVGIFAKFGGKGVTAFNKMRGKV